MRRLVSAFVIHKPPKTSFLASRPNKKPLPFKVKTLECNFFLSISGDDPVPRERRKKKKGPKKPPPPSSPASHLSRQEPEEDDVDLDSMPIAPQPGSRTSSSKNLQGMDYRNPVSNKGVRQMFTSSAKNKLVTIFDLIRALCTHRFI